MLAFYAITIHYIYTLCLKKLGKAAEALDTDSWVLLLYIEISKQANEDPNGSSWFHTAETSRKSYLRECYNKARPYIKVGEVNANIPLKYENFRFILHFAGVGDDFNELNKLFRPEQFPAKYKLHRKKGITESVEYVLVPSDWKRKANHETLVTVDSDPALTAPVPSKVPLLRSRIPIKPSFFLGRQNLLKDIHQRLSGKEYFANLLLLYGVGGMGKTTLMQQYLHTRDCQQHFDRIVFAAVDKDIAGAFINGAAEAFELEDRKNALADTDGRMRLVTGHMSKLDGDNLFVLDNVNESDYEELVAIKHTLEGTGWKFLITTRTVPDGFGALNVDELGDDDAALLFAYHYYPGNINNVPAAEREQILSGFVEQNQLASAIRGLLSHIIKHTLLTELLAKSGRKKELSVVQLLDALKEEDIRHNAINRVISVGQSGKRLSNDTLYQYMLGLFETEYLESPTGDAAIDLEHQRHAEMLRFFSLLPSDDIPVSDLGMLWDVADNDINAFEDRLDQLRQIGWLQGKQDETDAKELIIRLQRTTFKMHPLIQTVVYDKLKPDVSNCRPLVKSVSGILGMKLNSPQSYQHYAQSIIQKMESLRTFLNIES